MVKNLPVNVEDTGDMGSTPGSRRVPGVGKMASCSSILAWKISWREKPGRHSPWGQKKSDMSEHTHHTTEYHLLKAIGKSVCTHYKRCPYYIAECKKEISGQNIFF